jgi:hypothetical protein
MYDGLGRVKRLAHRGRSFDEEENNDQRRRLPVWPGAVSGL